MALTLFVLVHGLVPLALSLVPVSVKGDLWLVLRHLSSCSSPLAVLQFHLVGLWCRFCCDVRLCARCLVSVQLEETTSEIKNLWTKLDAHSSGQAEALPRSFFLASALSRLCSLPEVHLETSTSAVGQILVCVLRVAGSVRTALTLDLFACGSGNSQSQAMHSRTVQPRRITFHTDPFQRCG